MQREYKKAKPDNGKNRTSRPPVEPPDDRSPGGWDEAARNYEKELRNSGEQHYVLRLYVTGSTARSTRAIANIRKICNARLNGHYDLEVIDIYQQPVLARGEQIVAAPTLIKHLPPPLRRIIGDMSNKERVLMGLDLRPDHDHSPSPDEE